MAIKRRDQEFRLPKVTYIDYKYIEMDRVLTNLFPRLKYDGQSSRRPPRRGDLSLDDFITDFQRHDRTIIEAARQIISEPAWKSAFRQTETIDPEWLPELSATQRRLVKELLIDIKMEERALDTWFEGLFSGSEIRALIGKWVETDLMDVVNRGKPNQAIAAPRPLHGNTYKFRNARHTRDYNASDQIYWMLYHARRGFGQDARDALKDFFFTGVDLVTDTYDARAQVDVETQALLRLDQQVSSDTRDQKLPERYPPLCLPHGDLLADDVLRLLAYRRHMPRTVLVEYLKTLLAFHMALYHLKLLKLLPALVRSRGEDQRCGAGSCPLAEDEVGGLGICWQRVALVVDMGSPENAHMRELARRSADAHYRRIPEYIHAHFVVKKLDEMADYLSRRLNRLPAPAAGYFGVRDLLQLLGSTYSVERESYFQARMVNLIEDLGAGPQGDLDPEIERIMGLQLGDFETFTEILVTLRGRFHREYITQCLDALLLKNSDACLLRQSRVRNSPRYFSMGSRLLEVLLQIAVLRRHGSRFITRELSIEELLDVLRRRYGLYIDRLPDQDGFDAASIVDRQALRKNVEAFKGRLREIGFFEDLSDAFITQTVTSRYTIDEPAERESSTGAWS